MAALVVGDVVGPTGWRGAATLQAAQVINEAAQTTIKTADPLVNPGQYLKIQSSNLWGSFSTDENGKEFQWLDTEHMTMYIPADRNDEWVWERSGRIPTTFFDDASKEDAQSILTDEPTAHVLRGANGGASTPPRSIRVPLVRLPELPPPRTAHAPK